MTELYFVFFDMVDTEVGYYDSVGYNDALAFEFRI